MLLVPERFNLEEGALEAFPNVAVTRRTDYPKRTCRDDMQLPPTLTTFPRYTI